MLDLHFIRQQPETVKEGLRKKQVDTALLDQVLERDAAHRKILSEVEVARAEMNSLSEEISRAKAEKNDEGARKLLQSAEGKKDVLRTLEPKEDALRKELHALLGRLPNLPLADVPEGKNEEDNVVVREQGKKPAFGFMPRDYLELGEALDVVDVERAAKVSGSRFGYLKKEAALLEMALVKFAFDHLAKEGFISVIPPVFVKEEMMEAMGYVDSEKDKTERYFFAQDKMYLVGTAEQSLGPMHAGEVFREEHLPRRYAAFSTCFRREAGSYGKDTRGILRVHQFDKVEMFSFTKPEQSAAEHQFLLRMEEELMQKLGIPYRVVALCTGDLSQPSAATYDIEAWMPGQKNGEGEYRETHSASNTTDFQARRLNIRLRRGDERAKTELVHMLNGTAFAVGRTLIAIFENYQQEDGSIKVPAALVPYCGFAMIRRER